MAKNNKKLQEKYIELQMLSQQAQQMQKQLQIIEQQHIEVMGIQQALRDIGKTKKDTEILVPVSSGIFVKAKLIDNNNFTVNIGASAIVERNLNQTFEMLEKQRKELSNIQKQLTVQFDSLQIQMQKSEKDLNELMKQVK